MRQNNLQRLLPPVVVAVVAVVVVVAAAATSDIRGLCTFVDEAQTCARIFGQEFMEYIYRYRFCADSMSRVMWRQWSRHEVRCLTLRRYLPL